VKTIYVSDLDGTLLRNDATLSNFSRNILAQLLSEGLLFTVASARSIASIRPILAGLQLPFPVIEFNGAFITDLDTGYHAVINSLDVSTVESIFQIIRDHNCSPFVSTFDGLADRLYYQDILNKGMQGYIDSRRAANDQRLRHVGSLYDSFSDRIVCLTIIGYHEVLRDVKAAIEQDHGNHLECHFYADSYSPAWYWLTIQDESATKDRAIKTLLALSGLDGYESVVFGDHTNDIKMFEGADRSFAVANAREELKSYATAIIGSNEEDSVVSFIQSEWTSYKKKGEKMR
jgi:Cof subfamily protein (haloacid dehalogenase superfamily)